MELFAKIFELKDKQVLVTKDYDVDKELFVVSQKTTLDSAYVDLKANFLKEKDRDNFFDKYDKKNAENFCLYLKSGKIL